MSKRNLIKAMLAGSVCAAALAAPAFAENFSIPAGDLNAALSDYSAATGVQLIVSADAVRGVRTRGAQGELSAEVALTRILSGTGFVARHESGAAIIVPARKQVHKSHVEDVEPLRLASAHPAASSVETVVVTSSKIKGDIQTVPIAITALSQEQLMSRQIAGGPDLVKEVPNLTFSKTNFSGYNIEIRGIGTQAVSVTTDPAVAVSFNDVPFLRNHFFEQEFFDVSQVEVMRGPQGTLFGRNATAGVVNVISAKPTGKWEAMASADFGNYHNRRLEGMLNIPVVGDKLDLRIAGEWTKRDGYSFNEELNKPIDGRDLWSGRVSLLIHPVGNLTANLVWEHFQEDDDRERSTKQLCKRDPGPSVIDGPAGALTPSANDAIYLSQGCLPTSLYSPTAFETPNALGVPPIEVLYTFTPYLTQVDPYGGLLQNPNLRVTDSLINPAYHAKNDTFELNADYNIAPDLTLTSQTAYNKDYLYSTEDFDRFNTAPGIFSDAAGLFGNTTTFVGQDGEYCDPQLGCSSRLVGQDISREHARQFYQEVRLSSDFKGPLNFVAGANYLEYSTVEDYFVVSNVISLAAQAFDENFGGSAPADAPHIPFDPTIANDCGPLPASSPHVFDVSLFGLGCMYVDPNPLNKIDGNGHNYFRSKNPYRLKSWAGFGEVHYQVAPDVKLTGGLRWTDDKKSFDEYPSWTLVVGEGYLNEGTLNQEWQEVTGRAVANWAPKLDFTDQTMVYASYAHGYKGGGANPPGVTPIVLTGKSYSSPSNETHPLTFKPEFNDAFELGSKNTLLDGALTLNGDVFLYKYRNYQISQIVDRTSVNLNFDATVRGAELESAWEPFAGMRFNFAGGYEDATLASGSKAIDLMDRTAGHAGWTVVKPFVTETSNCVLPTYVVNELMVQEGPSFGCIEAYTPGIAVAGTQVDPVTQTNYTAYPATTWTGNPIVGNYPGFDPLAGTPGDSYTGQNTYNGVDYGPAPNNGQGFDKDVSGKQLPNAPHFTVSMGGDYTVPVNEDWAATLHADFYWQSQSWARVFNDRPYDKLRGYSNVNLALILTNANGWQVMGYIKNNFNTTAITGAFLNSDDTALTTNVFVTDPRLFGVRVTKNW